MVIRYRAVRSAHPVCVECGRRSPDWEGESTSVIRCGRCLCREVTDLGPCPWHAPKRQARQLSGSWLDWCHAQVGSARRRAQALDATRVLRVLAKTPDLLRAANRLGTVKVVLERFLADRGAWSEK